MRTFVFTVLFMFVAGMAFAGDIDGKWEGEVQGMDGNPMKISYSFKADGNTLTGTTKNPMDGSDLTIQDGKIDGNDFSFSLDFGMGQPMKHTGTIKGDTMELKFEMGDMGGGMEMPPMILKKVK
jgi:hypothetical protein